MAEPVGLTLSAVGLLPMFDTGLSLYGRLGSIKDYSADLKTLGITYEIERCRFQALQDELRHLDTTSEEQKNSTSPAEAHALKTLQQLIDAQTGQLKKGSHLSEKHAPVKRKSGHFSLPQLWNRSAAEDHETEAVTTPTLRRTIAWAASDKSRFQQTIQYLKDCNDQLELIASRDLKQLRDFKVRVAVLSPVNDEGELQQLMSQSSKSGYKCISKGAMVKSQQSTYENHPDLKTSVTHKLLWSSVRISSGVDSRIDRTPAQMMDRSEDRDIPVLIEWRDGFQTTKSPTQREIRLDNLTEMLGNMLSTASDSTSHTDAVIDFRVLECLGWITETGDFHRVGLVFRYPRFARNHGSTLPIVSLRDRIVAYRKRREGNVPTLGARFALAVGLAKALGNLFSVNWAHRRLRSHNILFFGNETLDAPFLSGFTYARPREELKISNPRDEDPDYNYYRPENYLDLLMHYCKTSDDTQTSSLPVTVGLDVYALGVVLLEIAEWRTVEEMEYMEKRSGESLMKSQLIWKHVGNLGARVGNIYQGVVERCLQEGCSDWKEKSVEEAMAVAVAVVEELSKCRA